MCKRAQCPTCHRPTYSGCGKHVEQVLGDVPASERCHCPAAPPRAKRSWFGGRAAKTTT